MKLFAIANNHLMIPLKITLGLDPVEIKDIVSIKFTGETVDPALEIKFQPGILQNYYKKNRSLGTVNYIDYDHKNKTAVIRNLMTTHVRETSSDTLTFPRDLSGGLQVPDPIVANINRIVSTIMLMNSNAAEAAEVVKNDMEDVIVNE